MSRSKSPQPTGCGLYAFCAGNRRHFFFASGHFDSSSEIRCAKIADGGTHPPHVSRVAGSQPMRRTFTLLAVGVGAAIGAAAAVTFGPRLLPQAMADTSGVRPVGSPPELVGLSERFEAIARKLGPAVVS